MNKTDFNSLSTEGKEVAFEKMLELLTLVYENPTSTDDLKTFTKWHMWTGKFGKELYELLIGVYPYPELDKNLNQKELYQLLKYSNRALNLVTFWNKQIKSKLDRSL